MKNLRKITIPRLFGAYFFVLIAVFFSACLKDKCSSKRKFIQYTPINMTAQQLRGNFKISAARALKNPGKIYFYNNYLFINELHEGIHVIDNSNPSAPRQVSFIEIPANIDMAVKDDVLYADSYIDLLSISLKNPEAPVLLTRAENVLSSWKMDLNIPYTIYYKDEIVEVDVDCNDPTNGQNGWQNGGVFWNSVDTKGGVASNASSGSSSVPAATGIGGSFARFTIYDNFLYTVDNYQLKVFSIKDLSNPNLINTLTLSWGIETIFPYSDKLFIGSNAGMFIYDNSHPEAPTQLSSFTHARACDPVVVENDIAYITLRNGTKCAGYDNQLEIVDVKSLTSPVLIKQYAMHNPHGLAVKDNILYLCENDEGLKVYDVKDANAVDKNLLSQKTGFTTYDVIALNGKNIIFVIGKDGMYQFDSSNPKDLKQLSVIPVKP